MNKKNSTSRVGAWLALFFSALGPTQAAAVDRGSPSQPANNQATVLSVFEVVADKDEGYRSSQTLQGSNTLTNLRDTPNSISVMNRELMDDLIAVDVAELSAYMVTGEVNTNVEGIFGTGHVFRGITGNIALRDGITWFTPVDSYNLERVEILRGPTAFLYGEGTAGGLVNQLSKSALPNNHEKVNLIFGSHDLYRIELDVNRRITDNFYLRGAFAYQNSKSHQNHAGREFKGAFLTATYTPFKNTRIKLNGELGRNHITLGSNVMADQYSTTERTGATAAISTTTGGYTYVPARGLFYRAPGVLRRSSGTGIGVFDESIQPRELNLNGPDGINRIHYGSALLTINQKVNDDFNIQVVGAFAKAQRRASQRAGSALNRIYIDTDANLPDGLGANPYFGEYYTESYHRDQVHSEPVRSVRATAVYDVDLKFTKQRLIGTAMYQDDDPNMEFYSETIDPSSTEFRGAFSGGNSLAAFQANRTVQGQNFFYRRYYLKDGDGADITNRDTIPGRSVMMRDTAAESASGKATDRKYKTPGYGIGASGTYFNGRLHSLVGWRRASFYADRGRSFYNHITDETYRLESIPNVVQPEYIRITEDTYNYGAVWNITKFVSAYFNYAQSMALSSGVGGALLRPGTVRGPGRGDGNEYGLRWSFLDGRVETNWTYYITNQLKITATPAIPAVVRNQELGLIFTDFDPNGGDLQSTKASGFELETVTNITKNWRLTWNFASNELETQERYPDLRYYQGRARDEGIPTPETDEFLATVPDGTPLPGFTKMTSNLVTSYRFSKGPLKNFSIGGGARYRDRSYRGNFDLDRDGTAEELWSPGYTLWNLSLGYRTKIMDRQTDFNVSVYNLFDKDHYRSTSLAGGSWQDGRSFRCAIRIDL